MTEDRSVSDSPASMSPRHVVLELIKAASEGDFVKCLDLHSEDVVVTLPFMLPEPVVYEGKAAQRTQLDDPQWRAGIPRMYHDMEYRDVVVHETTDPHVVVVQWNFVSRIGGQTVVHPNIQVSEVRDGKIVRTTDYHNHVVRAVANGNAQEQIEIIEDMVLPEDR
ncbi:nuclear transport factor 2 family protein [Streptomyces sp. NPDC056716]|uniref:nuclear transport factor 2 family protein n=1 Tax=unclassified Streptomyces TaxID=2593676 RepID=UPI0036C15634